MVDEKGVLFNFDQKCWWIGNVCVCVCVCVCDVNMSLKETILRMCIGDESLYVNFMASFLL